jgi:hypothetical protein
LIANCVPVEYARSQSDLLAVVLPYAWIRNHSTRDSRTVPGACRSELK